MPILMGGNLDLVGRSSSTAEVEESLAVEAGFDVVEVWAYAANENAIKAAVITRDLIRIT